MNDWSSSGRLKVSSHLEVVKGGGHGFGGEEIYGMVLKFFEKNLKAKK